MTNLLIKNFKYSLLLALILLVTNSCGAPPNYEEPVRNNTKTYNAPNNTIPSVSERVNANGEDNTKKETNNSIEVEVSKTLFISKEHIFNYVNGNKIEPVIIKLGLSNIFLYKEYITMTWENKHKIVSWDTQINTGLVKHNITTDDFKVSFYTTLDNAEIDEIVFSYLNRDDKLIFTKSLEKEEKKYTPNFNYKPTTSKGYKLKYLENGNIEVRRGENLTNIIVQYNKDNGTNYTLENVLRKNPAIDRNLKTIVPGQIIKF